MGRTLLVLLCLFLTVGGLAQETVRPAWLLVEQADRAVEERDFGTAIQILRRAQQLDPDRAETLYALGRVYKAINDFDVAEEYLLESLELPFETGDTVFLVRYELADIYATRRDLATLERLLTQTVELDTLPDDLILPTSPAAVLSDRGLDRFLVLYRLPETAGIEARSRLGRLFVGLGRYAAAADLHAVASLQGLTTLIDRARELDPLYEFETVRDLILRLESDHRSVRYLNESSLLHDLYYLAASFWAEQNASSVAIWRLLADIDPDGPWGSQARRQLRDPQPEPLLVPTR